MIFVSDNGMPFPGAKTNVYDAAIRLPLIVRVPGKKAGVVSKAMVSWIDVAPTVLEFADAEPPKNLPGRSLLPIVEQDDRAGPRRGLRVARDARDHDVLPDAGRSARARTS